MFIRKRNVVVIVVVTTALLLQHSDQLATELSTHRQQVDELNAKLAEVNGNLSTKEEQLLASHDSTVKRISEEHRNALGTPTALFIVCTGLRKGKSCAHAHASIIYYL